MSERQMEFAEALEESLREKALADVRARANAVPPPDFDGKHCNDCGDPIPPKRIATGAYRCVGCQECVERGSKLYRR